MPFLLEKPRHADVLRSFAPAFAGRIPTQQIRLGRSLSRHHREMKIQVLTVGAKPQSQHHEHGRVFSLYHKLKLMYSGVQITRFDLIKMKGNGYSAPVHCHTTGRTR